ncbi:MAG: threonine--tRNA ligase [Alphaproteobacteria bacterium]|nr:threonine--tRNA ligase [Alphaproteobacteria bacterium]
MEKIEIIRHSLSHIMAAAVKKLHPSVKVAIGPSIDNGFYYDFDCDEHAFSEEDFAAIEKEMKKLIKSNGRFIHEIWDKEKAREFFANEPYKLELIEGIEGNEVNVYHFRDFTDLCKGPHVETSKELPRNSFKLDKVAGAYWRGNSDNKMLQRIYAVAFETEEELANFYKLREEAEKRDHRKIGKAMDLFHFEPEYAPGHPFFHPKGFFVFRSMVESLREKLLGSGYIEIATPRVMNRVLWERSGHWQKYGENNFSGEMEDGSQFCIKPMNCPGGMLWYGSDIRSYKDLPLRVAEFGQVNRYEHSGALHGLFRVREFTQDDAHIFCTKEQLTSEIILLMEQVKDILSMFEFKEFQMKLSTRPEVRIGDEKIWDLAEAGLESALKEAGVSYELNEGDGAFYGPKIDFDVKDAIGRQWQLGTIQLDMQLPERFDLTYIGEDGQKHRPIMLHRALFGSIERFMGILIENCEGKFPLWMAPVQACVIPVSEKFEDCANKIVKELVNSDAKTIIGNMRVEKDFSSETMNKRIRNATLRKVPYSIIVGEKEQENGTVSIRDRNGKQYNDIRINELVSKLKDLISSRTLSIDLDL